MGLKSKTVVVGLSGGVDSAVSALLLKQQGWDVTGIFMKNWEDDGPECSSEEDAREARQVAAVIDIPFYTFNFVKEYWDKVFSHFLAEYGRGYTPNPDILCNKEIKFKCFLEKALALDVACIATGHYARVRHESDGYHMLKGVDQGKDQSYFLYTLGQNALSKTLFPLGELLKAEVREIAKKAGLPNWARKDSTGICFIGERKFKDFLHSYLGNKPGDIVEPGKGVVGRHDGLMYHTIGQRQGLGIGGPGLPWYVVGKDMERNELLAVQGKNHPLLFASGLTCFEESKTMGREWSLPMKCKAKIRYRQEDQSCTVSRAANGGLQVLFDEPQQGISPRQAVVFYGGEECLGGATIEAATALKN